MCIYEVEYCSAAATLEMWGIPFSSTVFEVFGRIQSGLGQGSRTNANAMPTM